MLSTIHFYYYTIIERILRAFLILIEPLPEPPSRHHGILDKVVNPRRANRKRRLRESDIESFFDAAEERP